MSSFRSFSDGHSVRELDLSSRAFEVELEDVSAEPGFRMALELFTLWREMPGDIPHINEVKLNRFKAHLLPSMYILDVTDSGEDFCWRLFGTDNTKYLGAEATGLCMSEAAEKETSAASALEFARECYRGARPVFFITEFFNELLTVRRAYSVMLPLVGQSGQIERLFGCHAWK